MAAISPWKALSEKALHLQSPSLASRRKHENTLRARNPLIKLDKNGGWDFSRAHEQGEKLFLPTGCSARDRLHHGSFLPSCSGFQHLVSLGPAWRSAFLCDDRLPSCGQPSPASGSRTRSHKDSLGFLQKKSDPDFPRLFSGIRNSLCPRNRARAACLGLDLHVLSEFLHGSYGAMAGRR